MSSQNEFSDRVAAYAEELRRYYRRTHTSAPDTLSPDTPEPAVAASVIPAEEEPTPPIQIEPPQERPWESDAAPSHAPTTAAPSTDTGYLRVRTFSARGAIPLGGVTVTVLQDGNVLQITQTDESGLTATFPLPTVSRDISLHPSELVSSVSYAVRADLSGYYSSLYERVPVYGGVTSVQEIAMIPIPEKGGQPDTMIFPGQIDTELN